jgi:hypothetical protein
MNAVEGQEAQPLPRAKYGLQEAHPLEHEDQQSSQPGKSWGRDELDVDLEGYLDHCDLIEGE